LFRRKKKLDNEQVNCIHQKNKPHFREKNNVQMSGNI